MSTSSPRDEAAGNQARQQAWLNSQLAGIALPELQLVLSQLQGQLAGGPNAIPAGVAQAFGQARADLGTTYDHARTSSDTAIRQRALQSGQLFAPGQVDDSVSQAATMLERDRQAGLQKLRFQEAQAGLQNYNQLMQLVTGGSQSAIGLGQGFLGASGAAGAGLKGTSQLGSILGGATTGASIGASIPGTGWYGAAGGAVAGGLLGAFGG